MSYETKTCKVKCIKGTSKHTRLNNAIAYWKLATGDQPGECSICGCRSKATDGAHVIIEGSLKQYIIPMCHACNENESEYRKATAKFVPVV